MSQKIKLLMAALLVLASKPLFAVEEIPPMAAGIVYEWVGHNTADQSWTTRMETYGYDYDGANPDDNKVYLYGSVTNYFQEGDFDWRVHYPQFPNTDKKAYWSLISESVIYAGQYNLQDAFWTETETEINGSGEAIVTMIQVQAEKLVWVEDGVYSTVAVPYGTYPNSVFTEIYVYSYDRNGYTEKKNYYVPGIGLIKCEYYNQYGDVYSEMELSAISLPGSAFPEEQREALTDLYNSTRGDNWTDNSRWKFAPLDSDGFSLPGTECGCPATEDREAIQPWFGVTCNSDRTSVIEIRLPGNNLIGRLPGWESGIIDDESAFPDLTYLDLSGNTLQDEEGIGLIPVAIGYMENLQTLYLNNSALTGLIPDTLGDLAALQSMRLAHNQLAGNIPVTFSGLTGLEIMELNDNQLIGTIPSAIGSLSNLYLLNLEENGFTASLPAAIWDLKNLTTLKLANNQLTGMAPVPAVPVDAPEENKYKLEMLDVSGNRLGSEAEYGTIDDFQLENIESVRHLNLGWNCLTGPIPQTLFMLPNLEILNLEMNYFSGDVPDVPALEEPAVYPLRILNLRHNWLQGLTSSLPNFSRLEQLYLSYNQLEFDEDPAGLSFINGVSFPYLTTLDLSNNKLAGALPSEWASWDPEMDLSIGYNALYISESDLGAAELKAFLDEHYFGWDLTQTVAPKNVRAKAISEQEIQVSWDPITYQAGPGGYLVYYALEAATWNPPIETLSKASSQSTISLPEMVQGETYQFTVRSFTDVSLAGNGDCPANGTLEYRLRSDWDGGDTHTIEIFDPPVVSIENDSRFERDGEAQFMVRLSYPSSNTVNVSYDVGMEEFDTAHPGDDYADGYGELVFLPEETSKIISVELMDDAVGEGTEKFRVELTLAENAEMKTTEINGDMRCFGTATILDDDGGVDPPNFSIVESNKEFQEGDDVAIQVAASHTYTEDLTVPFQVVAHTAEAGADYAITGPLSIVIPEGEATAVISSVHVNLDSIDEGAEKFTVQLTEPPVGTLQNDADTCMVTIPGNPDVPLRVLAVVGDSEITVEEGGSAEFTFRTVDGLTANEAMIITYQISGATVTADDADYEGSAGGQVVIEPGENTGMLSIPILANDDGEGVEIFMIALSVSGGATMEQDPLVVTIPGDPDIEPRELMLVGDNEISVNEGGIAEFTFRTVDGRTANEEMIISYQIGADTDTADENDYNAGSGQVVIPVGGNSAVISIPIVNDMSPEGAERFSISLSADKASLDVDALSVVILYDGNDGSLDFPTLSISDASVFETDEYAMFVVTASSTHVGPIEVYFQTAEQPEAASQAATSGDDFEGIENGSITIPIGERTAIIEVGIIDDNFAEGPEIFNLNLTGCSANATIADGVGVAVIADADGTPPLPELYVHGVDVLEGNVARVSVRASSTYSDQDISVAYKTEDHTAFSSGADLDYNAVDGILTIPKGSVEGVISVHTNHDMSTEGTERFRVVLSNPVNAKFGENAANVDIKDGGQPEKPGLSVADITVRENGGRAVFTVTASSTYNADILVNYEVLNHTAVDGEDFDSSMLNNELIIEEGELAGAIEIPILDDNLKEGTERFKINLSNANGNAVIVDETGIASVTDNDGTMSQPILIFKERNLIVSEGWGVAVVTVQASTTYHQDITIRYQTADLSATAHEDYSCSTSELTLEAGENEGYIYISIHDDANSEELRAETFQVALTEAVNATIGDNESIVTIIDNDGEDVPPVLSIEDINVFEEAGVALFTVKADTISLHEMSVSYKSSDYTAFQGDDYTAVEGTLTIGSGELEGIIEVPIQDDSAAEGAEIFTMTISNPQNATFLNDQATALATATIYEDDGAPPFPSMWINDVTAFENDGLAILEVLVSPSYNEKISVEYTTVSSGTAVAGNDFDGKMGTVEIPAGANSATITIQLTMDEIQEENETFRVTLKNPVNAAIVDSSAVVTIIDREPEEASVYAGEDQVIEEGQQVTLSGAHSLEFHEESVQYHWVQLSGPSVTLSDSSIASPTFVAPSVVVDQIIVFELVVSDQTGFEKADQVQIVIENDNENTVMVELPQGAIPSRTATGLYIGLQPNSNDGLVGLLYSDPDDFADMDGKPDILPYGLIDLSVKVQNPRSIAEVTIHLPEKAPDGYRWFKYVEGTGWIDFSRDLISGGIGDGAVFSEDRMKVTLYIQDNGPYDDDPAEGIVRDPSGLGLVTAQDTAAGEDSEPQSTGGAAPAKDGGSCFISSAGHQVSAVPVVLLLTLFVIVSGMFRHRTNK